MRKQEGCDMIDWEALDVNKFADENQMAAGLVGLTRLSPIEQKQINSKAVSLVVKARKMTVRKGMMESFLEQFGLSNKEGLALMCLAESLLRVPDDETADRLIAEKISSGDWGEHKGRSDSWLVNASTWGLMLTGAVVNVDKKTRNDPARFMRSLTRKAGEPVIRAAMMQAMRIMGEQFVVGDNIATAMERAQTLNPGKKPAICSFDMLGEGARTAQDAQRYFQAYWDAIVALGEQQDPGLGPEKKHGISVKLSALHPRYEAVKEAVLWTELYPKVKVLAVAAAKANLNFTIDAEEADRLIISLKILEKIANEDELGDWAGLGLAVQAYQKRGVEVIEKMARLARGCCGGKGRRLMVRLVKGAYWDTEIKHAQIEGHADFPVWTRKPTTDLAYLACARGLLDAGRWIFSQFATHKPTRLLPLRRWQRAVVTMNFSACTAWGMRCMRPYMMNRKAPIRAGSMPRLAPMRIYCPIWCAGCWKTGPILPLCIHFWMKISRPKWWQNHRFPIPHPCATTKSRPRLRCTAQAGKTLVGWI